MATFPCAKINLGLNVVARRPDGYHDLETVFYPIPLCDELDFMLVSDEFPGADRRPVKLTVTGDEAVDCPMEDNLVVKAYHLLRKDYPLLPEIWIQLKKNIPSQAGLGGGSSDAASMIRMLNDHPRIQLGLNNEQMEQYAAKLGADCAFFIQSKPCFATGIGDRMAHFADLQGILSGYYLVVVKPDVAVSTREAYAAITPRKPEKCCLDVVRQPIETWRNELTNDFELSVFVKHPELADIKRKLYENNAIYAQMSGSGSALFGIFKEKPTEIAAIFPDCKTFVRLL
ncbi:MAG: 4-(cytidine 5'-diphospho)-2-C-methyl-D-erythritol kinase [Prevotella sp.]|nr:4-(cytidine 5'-diphospho)-2-C-methyl-D-erythritol kinase [Prevotella sp.]